MAGNNARVHPGKRHANPMQYKSGKPRLGPLNLAQLNKLLTSTGKKKEKAKIQKRITEVEARAK
jgi:hypothetical protein